VKVELVKSLDEWESLRPFWDQLLLESRHPSVFLSFDYQKTAYTIFHAQHSEPFILTVYDPDGALIGILPLRRTWRTFGGVKKRVLQYLVTWEVDKSYIIARGDLESLVWKAACRYLDAIRKAWDLLEFIELPDHLDGYRRLQKSFSEPGYRTCVVAGPEGPIMDLNQGWEPFLDQHKKYAAALRRFAGSYPQNRVVTHDTVATIAKGMERYVAMERLSWKHGKVGLEKNQQHREFYQTIIPILAESGRVSIHILEADAGQDIAGIIACKFADTVFVHHTIFNSQFARYSPGKLLMGLILQHHMDDHKLKTADLLCGFAHYYNPWAERMVATRDLRIYRLSPFFRLYFFLQWLRRDFWRQ